VLGNNGRRRPLLRPPAYRAKRLTRATTNANQARLRLLRPDYISLQLYYSNSNCDDQRVVARLCRAYSMLNSDTNPQDLQQNRDYFSLGPIGDLLLFPREIRDKGIQ